MSEQIFYQERIFNLNTLIKDWHRRREVFLSTLETKPEKIMVSKDQECNQYQIKCINCMIKKLIFNQNCGDEVLVCYGDMAGEYFKILKDPDTFFSLEVEKRNSNLLIRSSFNKVIINYILQKEISAFVPILLNFYFCGNTLNMLYRIPFPEMSYNDLISKYPNSVPGIVYQLASIFSTLLEFQFNFGRKITKEDLIFTTKEFNDGRNTYPFTVLITNFDNASLKYKNMIITGDTSSNSIIEENKNLIRFLNKLHGPNQNAAIYDFYALIENLKNHPHFMKMFELEKYDIYPPQNSIFGDKWLYKDVFNRIQQK